MPLALHLRGPIRRRSALRLSDAATGRLLACDWPGNVRELKAVLLRAAHLCLAFGGHTIEPENLGLGAQSTHAQLQSAIVDEIEDPLTDMSEQVAQVGLEAVLNRLERKIIEQALDENSWNRTRTAASLGSLSRTTLLGKMKRLGLTRPSRMGPS